MITSVNLTLSELKQMIVELLLNKTDKISDISDDSVLNGIAFGAAKVGQKAIKDIAIVESQIFPETAKGEYLDRAADLFGVSERRGAIGSSTYVRVIATSGTVYLSSTHVFVATNGIRFKVEHDLTVDDSGFGYVKVRSIDSGVKTNVESNTITAVTPIPVGHKKCSNEYIATGGADAETDEVFRLRIVNNVNILSLTTMEYYNQIFQNIDDRVLKVLNLGKNDDSKQVLAIVTQNGVDLTQEELDALLESSKVYFPLSDLNQFGYVVGVVLQNISWYEIGGATGIDFRLQVNELYDPDEVRQSIQINISKKIDFRFWNAGDRIEWDDLLDIVKKTNGVKYVADEYFYPQEDEQVPANYLPRIKNFVMRDLDGNIIFDSNGVLSPIFYPSE